MSFKEHLRSVLSVYFIVAALINAATFILGEIFRPDEKFGYEAFLSPLIYAAVALIPMLCTYSKKELTLKQYVAREILQLIAIEIILIFFGLGKQCLDPEDLPLTASFALSVLIIFCLVHVIGWLLDLDLARQLNSDLKSFQSRFSDRPE
ncbi:MAG: hypothetical protein ACI4J0_00630 [Huintestinicola sp.]|uniref:hypothetical protein n=1 Tax=Huintestinicola sp. TaxID=2981661 RepID=UPI003F12938B